MNIDFTRKELQMLANAVTITIDKDYDGCTFQEKIKLYEKLEEKLDEYTEIDMKREE